MSATEPEEKRRRGRGLVLMGSLVANVFLVGLIAGGWLSGDFRPQTPAPAVRMMVAEGIAEQQIRRLARQLPDATRVKLRQAMKDSHDRFRANRRKVIQARRNVFRILRAEPFDAERLSMAYADLRHFEMQRREMSQEVFVKFLSSLDEQERSFVLSMLATAMDHAPAQRDRLPKDDRPGKRLDDNPPRRDGPDAGPRDQALPPSPPGEERSE